MEWDSSYTRLDMITISFRTDGHHTYWSMREPRGIKFVYDYIEQHLDLTNKANVRATLVSICRGWYNFVYINTSECAFDSSMGAPHRELEPSIAWIEANKRHIDYDTISLFLGSCFVLYKVIFFTIKKKKNSERMATAGKPMVPFDGKHNFYTPTKAPPIGNYYFMKCLDGEGSSLWKDVKIEVDKYEEFIVKAFLIKQRNHCYSNLFVHSTQYVTPVFGACVTEETWKEHLAEVRRVKTAEYVWGRATAHQTRHSVWKEGGP